MSFIKKEGDKGNSIWDWVLLATIVLGGAGFWWYYQSQKKNTQVNFERADSLFIAGEFESALKAYEELKGADYLEPQHDSILSERLDSLYTLQDNAR